MLEDLKDLLDDHQTGHSTFQDDYFITYRAGGTLYGQYKQALRELYKRFRGLREATCDRDNQLIDIKEQKFLTKNAKDKFEKERAKIEYKRKIMQMEESARVLTDTEREFKRFYQQARTFKEKLIEENGGWNEEIQEKLDREMWSYKARENVVIDLVTSGRVSRNTYEMIHSLPDEMRQPLLTEMKNTPALINWFENREGITEINFDNMPALEFKENDAIKMLEDLNSKERLAVEKEKK